jgi:hypothetical protein
MQSGGPVRRINAVEIMTGKVVDYQLRQSPAPLAAKHRVFLDKTGAP